jgi:signal peptide peptidase-like protein 2B
MAAGGRAGALPRLCLACCLATLQRCARAATGVLRLDTAAGAHVKSFPAVFAEWSSPEDKLSAGPVVFSQSDPFGCTRHHVCRDCAIVVNQGECTFAKKAQVAEAAGAALLIVTTAADGPPVGMGLKAEGGSWKAPGIPALSVSKKSGREVLNALDGRSQPIKATCWRVEQAYWDLFSELIVGVLAVSIVMLGAWHSVEDLRRPDQKSSFDEEVIAVEESSGPQFVVWASMMLTILFFFMKYLIYVLLFLFATGAVNTTTVLLEPLIAARRPQLRQRKGCTLPKRLADTLGLAEEHTMSDLVAESAGATLAVCFLLFRNNDSFGWMLQNTIAIMLLLTIQRTMRLPNLKVGTLLLVCTFFFDIFWVFLSPLIFKKSVMIEVATGGGTGQSVPMVLKIPALTGIPGQFKILGLGDIALPGLLISLLLRHDMVRKTSRRVGYFSWGVIGYTIGLASTFVSLYLMKHGQPALLFLVPGTLIPTFAIALQDGELKELWAASYGPAASAEGSQQPADAESAEKRD